MKKSKVRVLNKDGFKLPYLGRNNFGELMKLGLEYERGKNIFFIRDLNRAEEIKEILSEILNQEITFTQICLICGSEFPCSECKYCESCTSRGLPLRCICNICSNKSGLYDRYIMDVKQANQL